MRLLVKGATEPSTGVAGFYSSEFIVPKHTGGLQPILRFKEFNHYMQVSTFKMHTIRQVWELIQQGSYGFSIDLKDVHLHIPIVKYHQCFLCFLQHKPYEWKVLPFGLPMAPRVFISTTEPILFLCNYKGLHVIISMIF